MVLSWLRFNRRNSTPLGNWMATMLHHRFLLSNILNLDETPVPFEYLAGRTYDIKGAKEVKAKTDRSGWDKRQATLILYIFADGISRINPTLIFHGAEEGKILETEGHNYHPDVDVFFNKTAYNNEALFKSWIGKKLMPALEGRDSLLVMDVASFHKTPDILELLRDKKVVTSLIPGGCTGLLQPLDTAINKPFKGLLRDATEEYIDERAERGEDTEVWTVGQKRVMSTHTVATAWKRLCQRPELVQKAFRDVGISLPADGSRDSELRIKGFKPEELVLGDCSREAVELEYHQILDDAGDEDLDFRSRDEDCEAKNNYVFLTIKKLQAILIQRGLATSGNKAALVARLEEDDEFEREFCPKFKLNGYAHEQETRKGVERMFQIPTLPPRPRPTIEYRFSSSLGIHQVSTDGASHPTHGFEQAFWGWQHLAQPT